jgi:hypothetical protein
LLRQWGLWFSIFTTTPRILGFSGVPRSLEATVSLGIKGYRITSVINYQFPV